MDGRQSVMSSVTTKSARSTARRKKSAKKFVTNRFHEVAAGGYAILAEIYRLADYMPRDFSNPSTSKYHKLLFDFKYFEKRSVLDSFVDDTEEGKLLDEQFYVEFGSLIQQFFKLFDQICVFVVEFKDAVEQHYEYGVSDSLFGDSMADRQIQCECLYLIGLVLMILEEKMPGPIRERLFVAYYRTNVECNHDRFDLLVELFRTCDGNFDAQFRRLNISSKLVSDVIATLRSDSFKEEDDDSQHDLGRDNTAQAGFMFVCLFFQPETLHSNAPLMRSIVDKFFSESWVISLHLGLVFNVAECWDGFKAAQAAISRTTEGLRVRELAESKMALLKQIDLPHGPILLKMFVKYGKLIYRYNILLRWVILHCYQKGGKKALQLASLTQNTCGLSVQDQLMQLLKIANFEYKFKQFYRKSVTEKAAKCASLREEIATVLNQISSCFSEDVPYRMTKNQKLADWFQNVREAVENLEMNDLEALGTIHYLKKKIKLVCEIHSLEENVIVNQLVYRLVAVLDELRHSCQIHEDFLARIESKCDFSYAWTIVDQWSADMEQLIRKDVLPIRSLFVKLSDCIVNTLIATDDQNQVAAISLCYSRQLEQRLRNVIQAIPRDLFVHAKSIMELSAAPKGATIDKNHIRQVADLDRRFELAELTYTMSKLSYGILNMNLSWVGSLKIDPKKLLNDGLRRELLIHVASVMQTAMSSAQGTTLCATLESVGKHLKSLRSVFIYMCEHVGVNGSLLWQHEMRRLVFYWTELETNGFLRHKITDDDSLYQSRVIPIPTPQSIQNATTPFGRLLTLIMTISNPRTTYFIKSTDTWYDLKTKKALVSDKLFRTLENFLPIMALTSLDRIAAFSIVHSLQQGARQVQKIVASNAAFSNDALFTRPLIFRNLDPLLQKLSSAKTSLFDVTTTIAKIGHLQILRKHFVNSLHENAVVHAEATDAIRNLNDSVMLDLREGRIALNSDKTLLGDLAKALQRFGIENPLVKIYSRTECPRHLDVFCFLLLVNVAPKTALNAKRTEFCDIVPLTVGLNTLLHQWGLLGEFHDMCSEYRKRLSSSAAAAQNKASAALLSLLVTHAQISKDFGYP
ncbi:hypothetical protein L596_008081 [Steinernema carpocapsae]|uniref:WASH complex subunit strumpellin n=1 Tax=Steinernema carpocapsae TaxID=34508 RepID=A0A4U5PBG7_STECR|nr:hypothetical protein L596_008081 [Steinernema carpocapsae]